MKLLICMLVVMSAVAMALATIVILDSFKLSRELVECKINLLATKNAVDDLQNLLQEPLP